MTVDVMTADGMREPYDNDVTYDRLNEFLADYEAFVRAGVLPALSPTEEKLLRLFVIWDTTHL